MCVRCAHSCLTLCDPIDCSLNFPWNFPGKNTGAGANSYSRGSFRPGDWTCVSWVSCTGRRIPYPVPPGKPKSLNRCIRNPYCVHWNISLREPLILVAFKTEKVDPLSMRALIVSPCIFASIYPRVLEKRRGKTTSVPQEQPVICV